MNVLKPASASLLVLLAAFAHNSVNALDSNPQKAPSSAGNALLLKSTLPYELPPFDKITDVFHASVAHNEDQPSHLHVLDTNICATRCAEEYGNPCQRFCPAAVYEMEMDEATGRRELKVNFSNCVHCKTCDIADPYQIINWVTPEGGGGPNYKGM